MWRNRPIAKPKTRASGREQRHERSGSAAAKEFGASDKAAAASALSPKDPTPDVRMRPQAECAEALLRDAIDAVNAFAVFDVGDRLVLWNRKFLNIFHLGDNDPEGMSFEALVRWSLNGALFPAVGADEGEWLAERLVAHRLCDGAFEQELADDRWYLVEERRAGNGASVVTWTDISELKKRENALRRGEHRLRRFSEILLDIARNPGFVEGDIEVVMGIIAQAAAETLEVEKVGIWLFSEDRAWLRAAHLVRRGEPPIAQERLKLSAATAPAYFKALEADRVIAADVALEDPRTRAFAEQHLMPFGITSILDAPVRRSDRVIGAICHDHTGAPRHWTIDEQSFAASLADLFALALETRERQMAERAFQETARRLSIIAGNIPGMVFQRILQIDGRLSYGYLSEGTREIFGVAPEDALTTPENLLVALLPDERPRLMAAMEASARDLSPMEIVFRIQNSKGEIRWLRSVSRPYRGDSGATVWEGITLDITELKKTEIELRRAKDQAELANHAKSQFLANVSHELRTPLNAIIGFSEILKTELLGRLGNPRYREYAADIHASGAHLLSIINDILDLSKIEAGQLELVDEPVNVAELIESSVRMARARTKAGQITISSELPKDLRMLRADVRALKQMLLNILSNSIKFTPEGGVVVARAVEEADGRFTISISDTGIGIAAEDLPKVLTAFGQVNSHLRREGRGTGLGLPLVSSLVERHGGTLDIESQPGVGTTVSLHFPAERVISA